MIIDFLEQRSGQLIEHLLRCNITSIITIIQYYKYNRSNDYRERDRVRKTFATEMIKLVGIRIILISIN